MWGAYCPKLLMPTSDEISAKIPTGLIPQDSRVSETACVFPPRYICCPLAGKRCCLQQKTKQTNKKKEPKDKLLAEEIRVNSGFLSKETDL